MTTPNQQVRDAMKHHKLDVWELRDMLLVSDVTIYNWIAQPPKAVPPPYIKLAIDAAMMELKPLSSDETIEFYAKMGVLQQTASLWRCKKRRMPYSARLAAALIKRNDHE